MPILGSIIKRAYALRNVPFELKRNTHSPVKEQEQQLEKLIRKAQFTAFGEHYRFSELLNSKDLVNDFRKTVPVHDYNTMYKRWWYRSLNGEPYVSWPGKVKYFALSSGTSEASSKYIPVTSEMLRSIKRNSIKQLVSTVNFNLPESFYEKGMLMIGGSTHLQYNGTYYEGDLSGITAGNIPFWFQHFYKPGRRISKTADWATKLEEMVKNAPNWDIGVIVGVPAWVQILLERIIETHKLNTIHDLWPNLRVYVHSGVSIKPYIKRFEKLFGKEVMFQESYLASEGYIAYQSKPNTGGMELSTDNGLFFEFVPFTEDNFDDEGNILPNPKTYCIQEVKENVEYALLLSSNAGAWRYLIGDTVKITNKETCEIKITGRTKFFLSVCGEHLSLDNMIRAIELLQNDLNVEINEFTVHAFKFDNLFAHRWYLGTRENIDAKKAASIIDNHLKNLNDDYRVERMEAVKDVEVVVVPEKAFHDYMKAKGKEGSANKFPKVLKNSRIDEWEEFLKQNKYI